MHGIHMGAYVYIGMGVTCTVTFNKGYNHISKCNIWSGYANYRRAPGVRIRKLFGRVIVYLPTSLCIHPHYNTTADILESWGVVHIPTVANRSNIVPYTNTRCQDGIYGSINLLWIGKRMLFTKEFSGNKFVSYITVANIETLGILR